MRSIFSVSGEHRPLACLRRLPAVAHFVPISRCDKSGREQDLETGLHEMLIPGQRICYFFVLH